MMNTTEATPPGNIAGAQAEPAMFELVKYDRACQALAEARSADEVKFVRDVAMAIKLLVRQAKNRQMEADAFELRVRAERRLGEMIAAQRATVGLAVGGSCVCALARGEGARRGRGRSDRDRPLLFEMNPPPVR